MKKKRKITVFKLKKVPIEAIDNPSLVNRLILVQFNLAIKNYRKSSRMRQVIVINLSIKKYR